MSDGLGLAGLIVAVLGIGVAIYLFVRESRERAAADAIANLRLIRTEARSLVANLNGAEALVGIGPHIRLVLARYQDPPTWALLDANRALALVSVLEAWSASPAAAPMVASSNRLLRSVPSIGGGLSFLGPAADLLSTMATGRAQPSFNTPATLAAAPDGLPEIAQGLAGPLDYLANQLMEPELRTPDLDRGVMETIPLRAAAAFSASGAHEASLWLLRLFEVALDEVEQLPAKRIARLVTARYGADGAQATTYTGEMIERLQVTRRYEPRLADRMNAHVRRIEAVL
jgi:hypothetical protein